MRPPTAPWFVALALAWVGACAPAESSDPIADGRDRLRASDFQGAAASFEQALALEPTESARVPQLRLFYAQAVAHFDPDRALRDALDLIHSTQVRDNDLAEVVVALRESRSFQQSLELLVASVETHPESARLDYEYDATARDASKQGGPDALAALKGLGYIGGDSGAPVKRPRPMAASDGAAHTSPTADAASPADDT